MTRLSVGEMIDVQHVYWANIFTIGAANLDGTGVNQSFVTGANDPEGVAVRHRVYRANAVTNTIGVANLDRTDRGAGGVAV